MPPERAGTERDGTRSVCHSCGAELPSRRPSVHACDWWHWLDHQVELRRAELNGFERELGSYLGTAEGRFAVWSAERARRPSAP